MSFMIKKKKYKFQVDFLLDELSAVPFVNAVLFAKIRLLDGGTFTEISSREEVRDHMVSWKAKFSFSCKMSANASTGILDPCICRISIRKELKGGRSFQKLGFVDVNLAEFPGSGLMSRRFLLEGYDAKYRQDNSVLHITLEMTLQSGDPCFKVPTWKSHLLPGEEDSSAPLPPPSTLASSLKVEEHSIAGSITSTSSGIGSLPRKNRPTVPMDTLSPSGLPAPSLPPLPLGDVVEITSQPPSLAGYLLDDFEQSHSRNSSYTSQQSKASGYSSLHSRHSSSESGHNREVPVNNLMRLTPVLTTKMQKFIPKEIVVNTSAGSSAGETCNVPKPPERKRKQLEEPVKESRVDSTRVDADELINELIEATNLETCEDHIEASGLQLFIGRDGTTTLGSHELKGHMSHGISYEPVILTNR